MKISIYDVPSHLISVIASRALQIFCPVKLMFTELHLNILSNSYEEQMFFIIYHVSYIAVNIGKNIT